MRFEEPGFVGAPVAAVLLVVVQHLLRGRQRRYVHVVHAADFGEKKAQVVALGETGELRHVVEPNIHDAARTGRPQEFEEPTGGLLRETDGEDPHGCNPPLRRPGGVESLACVSFRCANRWACRATASGIRNPQRVLSARMSKPPLYSPLAVAEGRTGRARHEPKPFDVEQPQRSGARRAPPHPHLSDSRPANRRRWCPSRRLARPAPAARRP